MFSHSMRSPGFVSIVSLLPGQEAVRTKDVRDTARTGPSSMPQMREYLKNQDVDVRLEAVKQIIEFGSIQPALDRSDPGHRG